MENKSIIKIKIEKEDEIYNKFDGNRELLSEDLMSYITNRIIKTPLKNDITIVLESNDNIDINHFHKCFETNIDEEINKIEKQIKFNNFKKVRFFVIGLFFVVLSIILNNTINTVITELLSIVGSFAIWEMAGLFIVGNRALKLKKLALKREKKINIVSSNELRL